MGMKWFYAFFIINFSHYFFSDSLVIALGFPLPFYAFCDCIPACTSVQALGFLYRMAQTNIFYDTGNVKVFCRMVQPNSNIRQLDMS
jgi:hypothetical protein